MNWKKRRLALMLVLAAISVPVASSTAVRADELPGSTKMKSGTLRRGPDGKLYLDTSAPPGSSGGMAAPAATPAQPQPQAKPPLANSQPAPGSAPTANAPGAAMEAPKTRSERIRAALGPQTFRVCASGCDFPDLTAALQATRDGDTVELEPGVYSQPGIVRANGVTIRAKPGAYLKKAIAEDKGALVVKGDNTVIEGLDCSEIASSQQNGACVRLEGHNLILRKVHFHDAEEGVLTAPNVGTVTVEDSVFERLGADGRAHGIYVGDTDALIIRRSAFLSSRGEGHEVKSRAARTVIEDSVIASLDGVDSRLIDLPNGGVAVIRNTILEKGVNSSNWDVIGFGLEGIKYSENSLLIENCTVIGDHQGMDLVNGKVDTRIVNSRLIGGDKVEVPGLTWFPDRKAAGLDPYPALPKSANFALPKPEARPAGPQRICPKAGPDCDFGSLGEGLRQLESGKTIVIAAGTYHEAAVVRAHGVTIRAEEGAHIEGAAAEGKAALVIKGDNTTIEGLECSGITVDDHNGACIRLEGHGLTLRHVWFHDSEEGLLADDDTGDITIEDSRFEKLGAATGRAHGIYVGKAKSLTIRHSWITAIHGFGHEVKSRAAKTVIEDSVIASLDSRDSRLIDISNGGEAVVRNTVLEKGPGSDNSEAIGYGLEGLVWANNSLLIERCTIIMDRADSRIVRGVIHGQLRDSTVIGGGYNRLLQLVAKVADLAAPGRIGDAIDLGEDVKWLPDRAAAGLPEFPALPEK